MWAIWNRKFEETLWDISFVKHWCCKQKQSISVSFGLRSQNWIQMYILSEFRCDYSKPGALLWKEYQKEAKETCEICAGTIVFTKEMLAKWSANCNWKKNMLCLVKKLSLKNSLHLLFFPELSYKDLVCCVRKIQQNRMWFSDSDHVGE